MEKDTHVSGLSRCGRRGGEIPAGTIGHQQKGERMRRCDWLLPSSSHPAGPPERPSRHGAMRVPPDLMGWPGARLGTLPASATLASFGALIIQMDRLPRHLFSLSVGPPEMRKVLRRSPNPPLSPFSPERSGGKKPDQRESHGFELLLIQPSSPQIHTAQYILVSWGCGPWLLLKSGGLDGRALTHPVTHTASDPPLPPTNSGDYPYGLRRACGPCRVSLSPFQSQE